MTSIELLAITTPELLARQLGAAIRRTRRALRKTQAQVGQAVGLSQSAVSLIERGKLLGVTLRALGELCDVLDIRVRLTIQPPHLAGRSATPPVEPRADRQRHAAHARCSGYVRRRLERLGWTVVQEVEVVMGRSHGWIDVLAYHPPSRTLLIGEVKTEILDVGDVQRIIAWYEREALLIARGLGWSVDRSLTCLFVLATAANDERFVENGQILAQAFPVRSRVLARWLADPTLATTGSRALAMIDPTVRQSVWLRATAADGRRRPARYRDYAEFMLASAGNRARLEGAA